MLWQQHDIVSICTILTVLSNIANCNIIDYQICITLILKLKCNLRQHSYYPKLILICCSILFYSKRLLIAHRNTGNSCIETIAIHLIFHVLKIHSRTVGQRTQLRFINIGKRIDLIGAWGYILQSNLVFLSMLSINLSFLYGLHYLITLSKNNKPTLHILSIGTRLPLWSKSTAMRCSLTYRARRRS